MVHYFILCIISILCGMGILRIFKLNPLSSLLIYLAPVITFSFWAIFLGSAVLFNFPIKKVWFFGWILTLMFSLSGLLQRNVISIFKNNGYKNIINNHRQECLTLILIFVLPMIGMLPYFWHGLAYYAGSNFSDGWSYIAFGQYLWEYPKGTDGQLSPLYQYAAHLSDTRFIASSLLGFFSPLFGEAGDTQTSANLLVAWSLFNLLSACAFFASTEKLDKFIPVYLIFVIFSGILLKLLFANNLDNALILSILPAYAGISHLVHHQPFKWGVVLSIITAAALYTYIEMATFILFCAFILFIPFLYQSCKENKTRTSVLIFFVIALIVILCLPYLEDSFYYVLKQFNSTLTSTVRPGEGMFPELSAGINFLPAFWGLKPKFFGFLLGSILTALLTLGFSYLLKEKKVSYIYICGVLLLGTGFMVFYQHYDYGAYKLMLLNWWLIAFIITLAIYKLIYHEKIKIFFCIFMVLSGSVYFSMLYKNLRAYEKIHVTIKDIRSFKEVAQIKKIIQDKAVRVNVDDWIANQWAVYFLRDIPVKLVTYRGYMSGPHVIPYMDRAKTIDPNKIYFELTDNPHSFLEDRLIWKNGPYYLWEAPN